MARLQKKNLQRPDERRPVGRGQLAVVELGDVAIGRIAYEPGWRWSTDVGPIVGTELCEVHHVGVVLSGRLVVELEDGSQLELGPDDAFEIPPRHDAWVDGAEVVDIFDVAGNSADFGLAHAATRLVATIAMVRVSTVTRALCEGSGLVFQPAGAHELKGFSSPMELWIAD